MRGVSEQTRHLRCEHLVFQPDERRRPVPSDLCSCPAGLIHMHDCPVSMGRECVHFKEREGEGVLVPEVDFEELRTRLMDDYLLLAYRHRVRSLDPAGDPWAERRINLEEHYALMERDQPDPPEQAPGVMPDEAYEREKEHLLEARRKREADREQRRLDSAERARRGIKTVVERAQETVAEHGNVASSYLDELDAPADVQGGQRRRGRGGRRGRGSGEGEAGQAPKRRRPRGPRGPRSDAQSGAKTPEKRDGQAGGREQQGAEGATRKPARRRRRRRGGKGRPRDSSA